MIGGKQMQPSETSNRGGILQGLGFEALECRLQAAANSALRRFLGVSAYRLALAARCTPPRKSARGP